MYLLGFPKVHVEDFEVRTELDAEYMNAELVVSLKLQGEEELKGKKISYQLTDKDGEVVLTSESTANSNNMTEKFDVSKPHKWTAESPYLYTLNISLSQNDKVLQNITQKVGFQIGRAHV